MRAGGVVRKTALAVGLLLAIEGLCSLQEDAPKYRLSLLTGYEPVPGYAHGDESVNWDGLRGAAIAPRAPGRLRVLAMGESTTWGHKLADAETWPAALERRLARAAPAGQPAPEVLNGGVSGWGLEQVVLALRHFHIEHFQPDLVLVFAGWNHPLLLGHPLLPTLRDETAAFWSRRGLAATATGRRLQRWFGGAEPAPSRAVDPEALARAIDEGVPRLWAELASLSAQRRVPILGIRFPCLVQQPPPEAPEARAVYEAALRYRFGDTEPLEDVIEKVRASWTGALQRVEAAAASAGVPLLDVAGRMVADLPDDAEAACARWTGYFRDHFHFTAAGDEAVAQAVEALLRERSLLSPP